jgi:hypothetical protein
MFPVKTQDYDQSLQKRGCYVYNTLTPKGWGEYEVNLLCTIRIYVKVAVFWDITHHMQVKGYQSWVGNCRDGFTVLGAPGKSKCGGPYQQQQILAMTVLFFSYRN